jgi:serine protease Do
VEDLSEAAKKGLLEGDVIVEINQQAVNDPGKARDLIDKAAKNGRSSVLLLVNREGDVRFVALKLGE